jgi:hypothetical protein
MDVETEIKELNERLLKICTLVSAIVTILKPLEERVSALEKKAK